MERSAYPIEGDFIETKNHEIYEVKDFHQPSNCTIAFIRYFSPSNLDEKEGRQKDGINYRKIYPFNEKMEYMEKFHPQSIVKFQNLYFKVQIIPNQEILKIYKPEEFLQDLHEKYGSNHSVTTQESPLNPLLQDSYDFCKQLSDKSGIDLKYFGITGSTLLGLNNDKSDIDIIIYGFHNCLQVREYLRDTFAKQKQGSELRKYSLNEFKDLYQFRKNKAAVSFYKFLNYEVRKLHQGIFRDRDFFIRFLEYPSREEYKQANLFSTRSIQRIGRVEITAQVRGDEFWWTTPARIKPINISITKQYDMSPNFQSILETHHLSLRDITQTFTLRGRFIENARLLEHIKAEGTLEMVISEKSRAYLQLNFGNHPMDYLLS